MATDEPSNGGPNNGGNAFESAKKAFGDTAAGFTEQAGAKARDYAEQGKERAVDALDNVAGLVEDAASQVSEKLGGQYGGYIQQAADAVSGFATTLRNKSTDDLISDARNAVRSSPAIAIAAATAVGFLVARVVKSGFTAKGGDDAAPAARTPAARKPAAPKPAAARPAAARPAAKVAPAKATPAPRAKPVSAPKAATAKPAAAPKPTARKAAPKAPLADTPIADTPAPDSKPPAA